MKIDEAAARLEALGNPTRLRTYRTLVKAGEPGLPVGKLQSRLWIPASTLSHHLKKLRDAGIVDSEKAGLWVFYYVKPDALEVLDQWLS